MCPGVYLALHKSPVIPEHKVSDLPPLPHQLSAKLIYSIIGSRRIAETTGKLVSPAMSLAMAIIGSNIYGDAVKDCCIKIAGWQGFFYFESFENHSN